MQFPTFARTTAAGAISRARSGLDFPIGVWLANADAACDGLALDVALFACSAIFAALTANHQMLPAHGAWGRIAVWGYAAGALAALSALAGRRGCMRRFSSTTARAALCALVFVATALLPLLAEAVQRAGNGPDLAQGEVRAVEAS